LRRGALTSLPGAGTASQGTSTSKLRKGATSFEAGRERFDAYANDGQRRASQKRQYNAGACERAE